MRRETFPRVFRSILCPVDFSSNSKAALRYAAMLARLTDAQLFVIFVHDPLLATAAKSRPDLQRALELTGRDLDHFVTSVTNRQTPPVPVTLLTATGKPAAKIVETASRRGCDLIVMGYRGMGRAERLFFGSTTEGVVRVATVPVVAVPPARRRARLPVVRSHLRRAS